MTLTSDQTEALRKGNPVRLVEPTTTLECVILRAEVYDRLRMLLYDDGPLSESDRLAAIRHAGERAGWDDPELDVYEQYRKST